MSSGHLASPCAAAKTTGSERLAILARLGDYIELSKPRIASMVLLTVSVGYLLGSGGSWNLPRLGVALIGVALVAASGAALNQLIERRTDARMVRTANRPLPAGRLLPIEALAYGIVCATLGLGILWYLVNSTSAALGGLTLALYVCLYTPLKRYTAFSTAVGAIPGALPPVLGWAAAGGELGWSAFSLFAILYLWQFPHFLAIAWLYRRDYSAAGLYMLPGLPTHGSQKAMTPRSGGKPSGGTAWSGTTSGGTASGGLAGLSACVYATALIPASLLPGQFALAGDAYRIAAVFLGLGYLLMGVRFCVDESSESARGLLYFSLVYLPLLLAVLTWDHVRLLS